MTTIIHLLWSTSYTLITIIIYILSILYLDSKKKKFSLNPSNKFVTLFLVYIYNENLGAITRLISVRDYSSIEHERELNFPTLSSIHRNINQISKRKVSTTKLRFKSLYKMHKLILNNLKYTNIIDSYNPITSKVAFSILNIIVNRTYKNVNQFTLFALVLFRNSISAKHLSIQSYNKSIPQSYFSYMFSFNSIKIYNGIQKVIFSSNKRVVRFSNKINNIKSYFNIPYLIYLKKNYLYLLVINKYATLNIRFNSIFISNLKKIYNISFSSSNIVKYMSDYSVNKSVVLFLRRDKVFNKSRYSRNRQTYRTGAYWCLYLNIIAVIAFYFWFYKFTINFGYLWWLLYTFFLSFFVSRAIKYKFYNPINIIVELTSGVKWLVKILIIFVGPISKVSIVVLNRLELILLTKLYQIPNISKYKENIKIDLLYVYQSFSWVINLNNILLRLFNNYWYK